jgi:hypothetical protein
MSQANKPKRHYWELPLGVTRGYLEEPGPLFVDPYAAEERRAIQEIENGENYNACNSNTLQRRQLQIEA